MTLVYDKHAEEMKSLYEHLTTNKMSFEQFLRTFNFIQDMSQEQLNQYIEAYEDGEFKNNGWY